MKLKFGAILAAGFFVLSAIATATGNFAVRLDAATTQARQAAGIAISRVEVTQGPAQGYRSFTGRTSTIAPTEAFNIYFEPTGLATRFENGAVRASMSVDILIRDAAGNTVAVRDNAWQLPVAHTSAINVDLPPVYGDLSLNPLGLDNGRYQIVLRIHDDFAGTFADRVVDIEMRTAAAQSAQRLSQAPARR